MTQVSHNSPDAIINLEANYDFLGEIPCYEPFEYVVNYICPLYSGSGTTDVSYNALKKKESWEKKMKTIHLSDTKAGLLKFCNKIDKIRTKSLDSLENSSEIFTS